MPGMSYLCGRDTWPRTDATVLLCALWSSWPPASYPSVLCPLGRQQVSRMLRIPSLEPQSTPVASHGNSCLEELDLPFGK